MLNHILCIAYMSIVLFVLYSHETTSAPIYSLKQYGNFTDGVYSIYFVDGESRKAIDCTDDRLKIDERKGDKYQQFGFEKSIPDWYLIKCIGNNQCIDINSNNDVQLHGCHSRDNQLFKFKMTSDGYIIESKQSSLVWDVSTTLWSSGKLNAVKLNPHNIDKQQIFPIVEHTLLPSSSWDSKKNYYIYSVVSGHAIDCSDTIFDNSVQQTTRYGTLNQQFHIKYAHPDKYVIQCANTNKCWERTWWNNIKYTNCDKYYNDDQLFQFIQRPNGIAITLLTNNRIIGVPPDSSQKLSVQLKSFDMRSFDDYQLFRITESPITSKSFSSCTADASLPSDGPRTKWMSHIPDTTKINRVSIPATHETMGFKENNNCYTPITCAAIETQTLNLLSQLNAGIRSLDIRLKIVSSPKGTDYFQVWHGDVAIVNYNLGFSFDDVLNTVKEFLKAHKDEFILMRIEREDKSQDPATFNSIFHDYYNTKFKSLFWNPPTSRKHIPTVSDVRGKVVVLQGFVRIKFYGLIYKPDDKDPTMAYLFKRTQDEYKTNWRAKFEIVKDQLREASVSAPTSGQFYVNYLSSTGGIVVPNPIGASCGSSASDVIYGTNTKTYDYILHNKYAEKKLFVGIVYMDFPGQVLIDEIIKTNPSVSKSIFPAAKPGILKWITGIVNIKANSSDNFIEMVFDKYMLIVFALFVLLIISNIYCVFVYYFKTKAQNRKYHLVSFESSVDDVETANE